MIDEISACTIFRGVPRTYQDQPALVAFDVTEDLE